MDGVKFGPERKQYLRELIARFGYQLALHRKQSPEEQWETAKFIQDTDPFWHPFVVGGGAVGVDGRFG